MKICSKCKMELAESCFGVGFIFCKDKPKSNGLLSRCKECEKEYQKQYRNLHKQEAKEYSKNYARTNREKLSAKKHQYYLNMICAIKQQY